MRLLIITNNFPSPNRPYDGIFVYNELKELRALGHEVSVLRLVPASPPFIRWRQRFREIPDRYRHDNMPVRSLRAFLLPRNLGLEHLRRQVIDELTAEIHDYDPDIIHAHGLLPSGQLAIGHGRPVVVTAHGSDAYDLPWRRFGLRRAAELVVTNSTRLVAVSEFVKGHLLRLGASKVSVVYNGADDAIFKPRDRAEARLQLGEPQDIHIVAFVGHLMVEKGIYDLVRAVERLSNIKIRLIMVGDGPNQKTLRQRLERSGIDYKLYGALPPSKLAAVYQAADVVSLPSHREGLPAVICEAMLVGRVVIATDVGGIPEIVRDGVTGFTVPARNVSLLAEALRTSLEDLAGRRDMELKSRAFAEHHLTWKANAAAYVEIYTGLLN